MNDRRSFDIGVSQQVQGDLAGIVARLETAISQRTRTSGSDASK